MVEWARHRWHALWHHGLRPGSTASLILAVGCVVIATGVRMVLGLVSADSAVFAPYYSATLVAALIGGIAAGGLAAALGGIAACWLFVPAEWSLEPFLVQQLTSLVLYGISSAIIVWAAEGHRSLVTRLQVQESRQELINQELAHRIKNILANVQGIVSQSLRGHNDILKTVNARIAAYGATQDLLVRSGGCGASLRAILESEFAPYGRSRFAIEGQDLECPSAVAVVLALMIHELATNAVKHGALSRPEGGVAVCWHRFGQRLQLDWVEHDGPRPRQDNGNGFGMRLLRSGLKPFGGSVDIRFEPSGLRCRMSVILPHQSPLQVATTAEMPQASDTVAPMAPEAH